MSMSIPIPTEFAERMTEIAELQDGSGHIYSEFAAEQPMMQTRPRKPLALTGAWLQDLPRRGKAPRGFWRP